MNTKGNNHFQETHQKIISTVIDLLEKKSIRKITVSEICRIISINRSTFYEHFMDVYDVMEKTTTEYMAVLSRDFCEKVKESRQEAFIQLFLYILENAGFYHLYLNQGGEIHFFDDLMNAEFAGERNSPLTPYDCDFGNFSTYHNAFFKAGVNAMIRHWLNTGTKETPEEIFSYLKHEYNLADVLSQKKSEKE